MPRLTGAGADADIGFHEIQYAFLLQLTRVLLHFWELGFNMSYSHIPGMCAHEFGLRVLLYSTCMDCLA